MRMAAMMLALMAPATAQAQRAPAPAPASAIAPDAARVVAARELIDILMPPETRDQMIDGMMRPMLANIQGAMRSDPSFAAMIGDDPKVQAAFDQFIARQQQQTTATMREALPGMVPAMANAYARRFDVQQLHDIRTFFETPTGKAYMRASFTIMSDPDIQAWQHDLMTRSMARLQQDVAAFVRQTEAASKP